MELRKIHTERRRQLHGRRNLENPRLNQEDNIEKVLWNILGTVFVRHSTETSRGLAYVVTELRVS